jgi:hypothetical protein
MTSREILFRDNDLFAEGGFNWLSAILIRNGERHLEEGTKVYGGETAAHMISQELAKIEQTEYELATFSECDGLEVTKAGKIFSFLFMMGAPILIGKELGNILAGYVITILMLTAIAGFYWLQVKTNRTTPAAQLN